MADLRLRTGGKYDARKQSPAIFAVSIMMRAGYLIRISICLLLLAVAGLLTYRLDIAMHENRQRRIDLAEIRHIRYGLLNANVWADRIAPIFAKKIAAFDLTL